MQDVQNYQYYDPSPQPPPVVWWKRKRTWQVAGSLVLAGAVLVFGGVAAVNILKNHKLVGQKTDLMHQADSLTSQLGAACDPGDTACLDLARADAARSLNVAAACNDLSGEALATCVTLIAQDNKDPDVCKVLSGDDQKTCLDSAYLLQAKATLNLASCDKITLGSTRASCRTQVKASAVTQGKCSLVGVDVTVCQAAADLAAAIKTGDPAACAALTDEQDQLDCQAGITSVDDDHDGLVLADEVSRGLSDAIADSDGDGLSDGDEVHVYKTDPAKADTDGDGFSDGTEVQSGYDPLK